MKKDFKWKVGDQLSKGGAPSEHCEVKEITENHTTKERFYVIHDAGAPDWRTVTAHELETYWVRSKAYQKRLANDLNDPPEPQDPDFDEDGMPITFPDDE